MEKKLTKTEACEWLNMSESWLNVQLRNKKIGFFKLGAKVFILESELEAYVERCKNNKTEV